ncbi:sensor histidine kinase [Faecalimonas sp.]
MKSRIQRSMVFILFITLLTTYALMAVILYNQSFASLKEKVEQEADYIKAAIDISGEGYLVSMDNVRQKARVTVVRPNGEVTYDSGAGQEELENHKARKEIKEALESGTGSDVRKSDTTKERSIYYAIQLENGNVLRVARTMDNVWPMLLNVLPYMAGIGILMIGIAFLLARWQTVKLIRPINALNLEEPLENEVYEELQPLLEGLDKRNREKEAMAQMRKEFSANVSHELKTPLTSISGYAEIMKSGLVRPEDMQNFSERIYNEASRLITLIEDIIKLSKLDEQKVEMEKEDVDLFMLCREICSRLALQAEKKKVKIEVTGEPVLYRGIRQILSEMIYNLCENGIKYNIEGGTLSVWVGNTLQGKKVIIRDTGIGIPKEDQERIFERFYRVDKSHSKQSGGTGLGLSIVKHGAMLHQTDLQVKSEVGKGTTMELTF